MPFSRSKIRTKPGLLPLPKNDMATLMILPDESKDGPTMTSSGTTPLGSCDVNGDVRKVSLYTNAFVPGFDGVRSNTCTSPPIDALGLPLTRAEAPRPRSTESGLLSIWCHFGCQLLETGDNAETKVTLSSTSLELLTKGTFDTEVRGIMTLPPPAPRPTPTPIPMANARITATSTGRMIRRFMTPFGKTSGSSGMTSIASTYVCASSGVATVILATESNCVSVMALTPSSSSAEFVPPPSLISASSMSPSSARGREGEWEWEVLREPVREELTRRDGGRSG